MLALVMSAALALNQAAAYPDGFVAHCSQGQVSSVFVGPRPLHMHPSLRLESQGSGYIVEIQHQHGEFSVYSRGSDVQSVATNGKNWTLDILKQEPGDLVLSLNTTAYGASVSIYHLRYEGTVGMLTIAMTGYYGYGPDESSLSVMTCSIETRSGK